MAASWHVRYERRPSALAYMIRACRPSPRVLAPGPLPLRATWQHRVDRRELADFLRLAMLTADAGLPIVYPHVFGFRLHMALLTHRRFPVPLWGALQIRNRLLQHRPIPPDAVLDVEAGVACHRVLEKGAEFDLQTTIHSRGDLAWESLTTIYYRGRFGDPVPPSPLARTPEVGETVVAEWHMPAGVGWRFGRLTGDYNPIHWSRWYARRFGFQRDFHHPQLVIGRCLAHLPRPATYPQRLDAWLKGPVYYESDVRLRVSAQPEGASFAVMAGAEARPAIVGRWGAAGVDERLLPSTEPRS